MGKVVAADTRLRAWGANSYLDVKGMFHTTLVTSRGATKQTKVYVVDGFRPEPLLGDSDAEALGIIQFSPEGREATKAEMRKESIRLVVPDLRRAGITVKTAKDQVKDVSQEEKKLTMKIVEQYKGSVFTDRIGLVKSKPIRFEYRQGFKPTQAARIPVPVHYQEKLSRHLNKLRREGVIDDVDPREAVDCVLNIRISEKKTAKYV